MLASPRQKILTPQHYLEWEESQELRYEYVNGEVFAMTGRTIPHNDIAVNLTTAKKKYLRGKDCKVFMAYAKVGIPSKDLFTIQMSWFLATNEIGDHSDLSNIPV